MRTVLFNDSFTHWEALQEWIPIVIQLHAHGSVTAQAISCWLLITEARIQSQGSARGLHGEQSGIQTGFFWVLHLSPVNYHSTSSSYSCIYHLGLVQVDHYELQCQVTRPVSNHHKHKMVNVKNINTGHTFNPLTTAYRLNEDWQKHTNPYQWFVKLKRLQFQNVVFWVATQCSLVGKYTNFTGTCRLHLLGGS